MIFCVGKPVLYTVGCLAASLASTRCQESHLQQLPGSTIITSSHCQMSGAGQVRSISLVGRGGGLLRSGQRAPQRSEVGEVLGGGAVGCWERETETQLLKPLTRLFEVAVSRPATHPSAACIRLERRRQRPSRESTEHAGPRFTGAYTLIAPNEKRRNEIQQMAAKELEELERWKEQQRVKSITLPPMTLGGSQSEAEVRRRQQLQLIQSKYQKKLKREECVRIKKEAEEAEVRKMRAAQREKSNKLEEKKRLQENLRRETFREHQQYKTAEFLRRFEADLPHRGTCPVAGCDPQSSAWARRQAYMDTLKEEQNQKLQKMKEEQHQKGELLEFKRQQQEEERTKSHQAEHRRVNNAFLDRLQGKSQPGGLQNFGGYWNMNSGNSWVPLDVTFLLYNTVHFTPHISSEVALLHTVFALSLL